MTDSFHSSDNSSLFQIEFISWNKAEKQNGRNTKERRKGAKTRREKIKEITKKFRNGRKMAREQKGYKTRRKERMEIRQRRHLHRQYSEASRSRIPRYT
jgi:hypothetical protein